MVCIGVVDSGGPADATEGARAFLADGSAAPATPDRLGHGSAVAAIITRACPVVTIRHAQVFDDRPTTSALRVAAGLRWLAGLPDDQRPQVICLSLGLTADRAALRAAIAAIVPTGTLMVAAHPAQGAPCYPAAYPGVIAATGDARCGWDQISQLGPHLFGAWCDSPEQSGGMGGASLGAARLTGHLAQLLAAGMTLPDPDAAMAALAGRATFFGPERRRG